MHTRLVIAFAALCAGCGPEITLTDDIDLTWDFGITLSRFDSTLHGPYVRGTAVGLFVSSTDEGDDLSGWSVESSDPTVFRVGAAALGNDRSFFIVDGEAIGVGTARLTVLNERNRPVGSGTAEVLAPDRVELDAHGYLILGRDAEAPVDEARILAGGRSTYLVRYFHGDRELHGNGVLSIDAAQGVDAEARTTFLFENREWLTVGSPAPGTSRLALHADGLAVGGLDLVVVPETELASVALLTQSERGHADGDWLVALAQAYDGSGRRILGVDFQWDVDGIEQIADGDLYRYEFKKGQFQMVTADRAGHSSSTMIQSEEGFVGSSNHIGCAAGHGGAWPVGLVAVGLILRRRQRRTTIAHGRRSTRSRTDSW